MDATLGPISEKMIYHDLPIKKMTAFQGFVKLPDR